MNYCVGVGGVVGLGKCGFEWVGGYELVGMNG